MTEPEHPASAQMASPTYRLASIDQDFILGPSMRGVRFLLEFAKVDEALKAWGVTSTLVVFGSARIREDGPDPHPRWYAAAREFARIASKEGGAHLSASQERHNVICTGGGPGIMEAANRGAHDVSAPNVGLNISLPFEQSGNRFITPTLSFKFHYFALRKMHFMMRAKALVAFPGGFGTLDELFEVVTLVQTRKAKPVPIILFGSDYWKRLVNLDVLVEEGAISPDDLKLFQYVDDPQVAWDAIRAFYQLD